MGPAVVDPSDRRRHPDGDHRDDLGQADEAAETEPMAPAIEMIRRRRLDSWRAA